MSWFATLFGGTIGFLLGGPLGALAGAALGNAFSGNSSRNAQSGRSPRADGGFYSDLERVQATYFVSLFTLLGKIAKADGVVQESETKVLLQFLDEMKLEGRTRQFAIDLFNEAKYSSHSIQDLAKQFHSVTGNRRDLQLSMIDMLYRIAMGDGELHTKEEEAISIVVNILNISKTEHEHIQKQHGAASHKAYHVLGVSPDASNSEIRAGYRRLVKEYHPDYAIAQGMPDEFIRYANKRFNEVQDAWDTIRAERSIS